MLSGHDLWRINIIIHVAVFGLLSPHPEEARSCSDYQYNHSSPKRQAITRRLSMSCYGRWSGSRDRTRGVCSSKPPPCSPATTERRERAGCARPMAWRPDRCCAGCREIEKPRFIYRPPATGAHLDRTRQQRPSRRETATRSPWPFICDTGSAASASPADHVAPSRLDLDHSLTRPRHYRSQPADASTCCRST